MPQKNVKTSMLSCCCNWGEGPSDDCLVVHKYPDGICLWVPLAVHFQASREARWLIQAQKDANGTTSKETPTYIREEESTPLIKCDNQGALAIVSTGAVKQRTKHIDVCYQNSRNLRARGIVEYTYAGTDENVADLITKPLALQKHQRFTAAARLRLF